MPSLSLQVTKGHWCVFHYSLNIVETFLTFYYLHVYHEMPSVELFIWQAWLFQRRYPLFSLLLWTFLADFFHVRRLHRKLKWSDLALLTLRRWYKRPKTANQEHWYQNLTALKMGKIQGSKASSLYPLLRSMRAVTRVFYPPFNSQGALSRFGWRLWSLWQRFYRVVERQELSNQFGDWNKRKRMRRLACW